MADLTLASKNAGAWRHQVETTVSETPADNTWQLLAHRSVDFKSPIGRNLDTNRTTRRQSTFSATTGYDDLSVSASGLYQLGAGLYFWQSVLGGASLRAAVQFTGTNIAAVNTGNKLTRTNWTGVVAGRFVRVSGFSTNAAVFYARVTAVSGSDLTLSSLDVDLVDESAGATVTVDVMPDVVADGTQLVTMSHELWNSTQSVGQLFSGCAVTEFGYTAEPRKPVEYSMTASGLLVSEITSATAGTYSNGGLPTGVGVPAGTVPGETFFGGATPPQGLALQFAGAAAPDLSIAKLGVKAAYGFARGTRLNNKQFAGGARDGRITVTLDIELLSNTAAEAAYADREDATSLKFGAIDSEGNVEIHYFPGLQGDLQRSGFSEDGLAMHTGQFSTYDVSPTGGMQIAYWAAP